jgi:hypothetical protein
MVELYLHSPIYLHGTVLNYITKYRNNVTFTLLACSRLQLQSAFNRTSRMAVLKCKAWLERRSFRLALARSVEENTYKNMLSVIRGRSEETLYLLTASGRSGRRPLIKPVPGISFFLHHPSKP